jgi:hypothetical protein
MAISLRARRWPKRRLPLITRCALSGRKNRHYLHIPASALAANQATALGQVNEDHVVPEPQLLECLYRLMMTALAQAMHFQGCFARSSGVRMVLVGTN